MTTNLAVGIFLSIVMMVWSTVLYAWVDERQQRAAYRDLIARAAIRRRHDRELAEIRYYLQAADKVIRPITAAPVTQPIAMPAPEGPATQPGPEVAAQQVRELMEPLPAGKSADWVEEELARFNFSGRNR